LPNRAHSNGALGRGRADRVDACYVALAEQRRVQLVTADDLILSVAGQLARPLSAAS